MRDSSAGLKRAGGRENGGFQPRASRSWDMRRECALWCTRVVLFPAKKRVIKRIQIDDGPQALI